VSAGLPNAVVLEHAPAAWWDAERRRAAAYPLARWYLRPAAAVLAQLLAATPVRPTHLTACGLAAAAVAAALVLGSPAYWPAAGVLVLVYWFFDRADGQLARLQGTPSPLGAWLDANVDELADLGLHTALAFAAAEATATRLPLLLLIAFLAGKYLLMYGLNLEQNAGRLSATAQRHALAALRAPTEGWSRERGGILRLAHYAYHLPANADIRVHLLALALVSGCLTAELAFVAAYYNVRWLARYVLVARRLRGAA